MSIKSKHMLYIPFDGQRHYDYNINNDFLNLTRIDHLNVTINSGGSSDITIKLNGFVPAYFESAKYCAALV